MSAYLMSPVVLTALISALIGLDRSLRQCHLASHVKPHAHRSGLPISMLLTAEGATQMLILQCDVIIFEMRFYAFSHSREQIIE